MLILSILTTVSGESGYVHFWINLDEKCIFMRQKIVHIAQLLRSVSVCTDLVPNRQQLNSEGTIHLSQGEQVQRVREAWTFWPTL